MPGQDARHTGQATASPASPARTHLAIVRPPYDQLLLTGAKQVECRLTRSPCAPYAKSAQGDHIYLKRSSGPVFAQARVQTVLFHHVREPAQLDRLIALYQPLVQASPDFWDQRRDCPYLSLVWLHQVAEIPPQRIRKADWRAWVVMTPTDAKAWGLPLGGMAVAL